MELAAVQKEKEIQVLKRISFRKQSLVEKLSARATKVEN